MWIKVCILNKNWLTEIQGAIKIINTGNAGKNRIEYLNSLNEIPLTYHLKSDKGETQNLFDYGDLMEYVGYATINGVEVESEVIRQLQIGSESFELMFPIVVGDGQPCSGIPTLTDIDGNVYNTVQIGSQCWMKENLRVTKYANDTTIPLWNSTNFSTVYRYYPDNDSSNVSTYGYLYNWAAVMGGSGSSSTNPSGMQGICPAGWHLPSDAEWTQLTELPAFRLCRQVSILAVTLVSATTPAFGLLPEVTMDTLTTVTFITAMPTFFAITLVRATAFLSAVSVTTQIHNFLL